MRATLPLLALLAGCSSELDPELQSRLQDALDEGKAMSRAPGATVSVVVPGEGSWLGAAGDADVDGGVPAAPEDRFRIGSITKTFVATVVLQLDAEGVLSIDDRVSDWRPDAPHAEEITLRQLLSHTSGLDDYVDDLAFLGHPTYDWTPEEVLAIIADRPLLFDPGTDYTYSNANFVVLGMVIETASGVGYADQILDRLLVPLGLEDISLPTVQPGTDTDVMGYLAGGEVTDIYNPLGAGAAGEMVSDADDLTAWGQALYGGEVLDETHTALMTARAPISGGEHANYGLGCQVRNWYGRSTVGHSGSTMGFRSRLRYDLGNGMVTAVLINDFTAEADEIDARIWDVLVSWYGL